jgi:tRNA pseudouridine55 synthase
MPDADSHSDLGQGGILLVDKPCGMTSFDVVDRVRRALLAARDSSAPQAAPHRHRRRIKCGHAGTLDPAATGLLVLMYGMGTRLSPFLMGLDKTYTATLRFGVSTDTLDATGKKTEVQPVTCTPRKLESQLSRFLGAQEQVPPAYSAIKWKGQPLYKRARRGESLPRLAPRPIYIHRLTVKQTSWGEAGSEEDLAAPDGLLYEATLEIECSSGTYIRALARDLAATLDTVGYVQGLRRDQVGPFPLAKALALSEDLAAATLINASIALSRALPHLPRLGLSDPEARCIRQGQQPEAHWLNRLVPAANPIPQAITHFTMVDPTGQLVAVGKLTGKAGIPRSAAVFPAPAGEARPCA